MPEQIALTQTQEGVLFALEQRRREMQAMYAELTQAMNALGEHYARQAGLAGEGAYQTTLSMQGRSVVQLIPPDEEDEHENG